MKIIFQFISYFTGYASYKKLQSFLNLTLSYSLARRFKTTNGLARFCYPIKCSGLQYITIGKNFNSAKNLRLQAIDEYRNFHYNPKISIGDNVSINPNCQISAIDSIIIGNDVLLASNVFISDQSHGFNSLIDIHTSPADRELVSKGGIVIEDKVWIGQNVSILPNVKIGRNSIIGANSVVTKNIPSFSVAVGSPAIVLKKIVL